MISGAGFLYTRTSRTSQPSTSVPVHSYSSPGFAFTEMNASPTDHSTSSGPVRENGLGESTAGPSGTAGGRTVREDTRPHLSPLPDSRICTQLSPGRLHACARTHTHTHTLTHTGPGTSRGLGKGKGPTTKAMGLRLPPPGAPAWVLALSVAPEAAKPLHGELGAPREPGQACMPGLAGAASAPGGRGPGGAPHGLAGVGPESSEMPPARAGHSLGSPSQSWRGRLRGQQLLDRPGSPHLCTQPPGPRQSRSSRCP